MGRNQYLTRLGLGRSAFGPPIELNEPPVDATFDGRRIIQRYDERGHPINPQARQFERIVRRAQNDVLAAVGVVTRDPAAEAVDLQHETEDSRRRQLELKREDSLCSVIKWTSEWVGLFSWWWIRSLRDRILVFSIDATIPFLGLVASEFQRSGSELWYAGFLPFGISCGLGWVLLQGTRAYRPLDRLLFWLPLSRDKRLRYYGRLAGPFSHCVAVLIHTALFPFFHLTVLQKLGLAPAKQLLPSWKAYLSFFTSATLPRRDSSFSEVTLSLLTCPLAIMCGCGYVSNWQSGVVVNAFRSIYPPSVRAVGSDYLVRGNIGVIESRFRTAMEWFLIKVGWALPQAGMASARIESMEPLDGTVGSSSARPPRAPTPHPMAPDDFEPGLQNIPMGDTPNANTQQVVRDPNRNEEHSGRRQPRKIDSLSRLRCLPVDNLCAWARGLIEIWTTLPLRYMLLRVIASRHLSAHPGEGRVLHALPERLGMATGAGPVGGFTLASFGTFLSRVALCNAMEIAMVFGFWGIQYGVVRWIGTRFLHWGAL